jgi:hypothetical protein
VSRVQKVILTIGVVVALALAGTAVYASNGETTVTQGDCLERSTRTFDAPRSAGGQPTCLRYDDAVIDEPPLDGTSPLWWFGAAAAVVLTGLGLVLVRKPT